MSEPENRNASPAPDRASLDADAETILETEPDMEHEHKWCEAAERLARAWLNRTPSALTQEQVEAVLNADRIFEDQSIPTYPKSIRWELRAAFPTAFTPAWERGK